MEVIYYLIMQNFIAKVSAEMIMAFKEQRILAEKLEALYNLKWEEYLERFQRTQPLELWALGDMYPRNLTYLDMNNKDYDEIRPHISSRFFSKKFVNSINVEIGFNLKVNPEKIRNTQYFFADPVGMGTIFQEHLVDKMLKYCPEDFEPVAVTLANLRKKSEPFEIKGFYALNVLKVIKAVDEEKSHIRWDDTGIANITKLRYKDNPWQDGCDVTCGKDAPKNTNRYPPRKLNKPCLIAIDALTGAIVWHPRLAALIPPDSHTFFARDFETELY